MPRAASRTGGSSRTGSGKPGRTTPSSPTSVTRNQASTPIAATGGRNARGAGQTISAATKSMIAMQPPTTS